MPFVGKIKNLSVELFFFQIINKTKNIFVHQMVEQNIRKKLKKTMYLQ